MSRNLLWSFVGTGLPMLVAFVAVPQLIEGMGTARFGVLSLAWMVVGYFSLFDLGLGRAMTQLVAEKLGKGEAKEVSAVVWTSMGLMAGLGAVGAVLLAAASDWLVHSLLKIPTELAQESRDTFRLLALSLPVVITMAGLRGVLEAHQRFDMVNLVRVPLGIVAYLGPLAMLQRSNSLSSLVLTLVVARLLAWLAYLFMCLRLYPELRRYSPLASDVLKRLLTFGGWMTVSNITAPFLLYLGRFMIAILLSAQAVAYFSTPYDVLINLLIIPGVFVGVLFPVYTQLFQQDVTQLRALYGRSMSYVFVVMLPLAVIAIVIAKPGLEWWINPEFAVSGYKVAQILAVGIFINSFGHISQSVIQAYGRPDVTAKLHVVELIAYVPYSWWLINLYGIDGAALAWMVRASISTMALSVLAQKCITGSLPKNVRYAA